eukprot:TRINITY_DN21826_c0_g1_i2.p1 TRINITY_DN21826_c0_g1~~TRINITY_DN21826_c0_g1_i2.p1  ORF type:complete len:381 (-),score=69.61 TRINITY_DN21826_c0_g1_i2:71-1186(-)
MQSVRPAKRARLEFFQQTDIALKVLVTPNAAGKIIGRGGSEIANLRQQIGVTLHICGLDSCFPGTSMQVAVLGGARQNVDQAIMFVVSKIAEDEYSPRSGEALIISLAMSTGCISKIIGTRGATISKLRTESGCHLSADKEHVCGEQLLHITGQQENLAIALQLITPFIEEAGDSQGLAIMDYAAVNFGGCEKGWGGGKGAAVGASKAIGAKGGGGKGGGKGGIDLSSYDGGSGKGWGMQHQIEKGKGKRPGGSQGESMTPSGVILPGQHQQLKTPATTGLVPPPESGVEFADQDPAILESPAMIAFSIPSQAVSRVLGKGGSSATEIRRATGAQLSIDPGEAEGVVTLTGTVHSVHRAHCMVVARVKSPF